MTTIVIQGTTYNVVDMDSARMALGAAQNSSEVLGVLNITNQFSNPSDAFTVSELTIKANSLSTIIPDAEAVLLYSGDFDLNQGGGLPSGAIAEAISNASVDSQGIRKVALLDKTDAANLVFDNLFENALDKAIVANPSSVPSGVTGYQIVRGKTSPTDSTPTVYNNGKGVADDISAKFIADHDTLPVRTLVATADDNGTFTKTEITALRNSDAPSVEGIPKATFNKVYDDAYAKAIADGKSAAQAEVDASRETQKAVKAKSFENALDLDVELDGGLNVTKVAANGEGWANIDGVDPAPIPDTNPGKFTLSEGLSNVSPSQYDDLAKGVDAIARAEGHVGFGFDDAAKLGAKGLVKAGIVGDVMGVVLAASAAQKAYAAGDVDGAARIIGDEVAGIVGGVAVGAAAVAVAAMLLPAAGVVATAGMLIAGMAGGIAGDVLGRELWGQALDKMADLGLVPEGGLPGLLDDLNWGLDNPLPVLGQLLPPWLRGLLPIDDVPGLDVWTSSSPLVLDINMNGLIDLVSVGNSTVKFDFWNDGFAEATGWVAPEDGFLVRDIDASGTVDGMGEMFGSNYPLGYLITNDFQELQDTENGFAKLELLDSNQDGIINASDMAFNELKIWRDLDQDGVSDAGELFTLSELNIASIDVGNYELEQWNGVNNGGFLRKIEGNTITHTSSFTMTDNSTWEVVDAWFANSLRNSSYVNDYTLDVRVLFLPILRGYGNLPDLHVAMSQNEGLLTMVRDFTEAYDSDSVFNNFSAARSDATDIMLAWAGVTGNEAWNPMHGQFGYMNEYLFLRKFTGVDSPYLGSWFDGSALLPWNSQGVAAISQTWDYLLDGFMVRLAYQSGGAQIFESGTTYNASTDTFEGVFRLSQDAIGDLEVQAGLAIDLGEFWHNIALFISRTMGEANLNSQEISWLNSAIYDSSSGALTWESVLDTTYINYHPGTSGDDTIHGTKWNDSVATPNTANGNDTLYGHEGNDSLYGENGNDVLIGGSGNDILYGGWGDDTYVYESGHDVIVDNTAGSVIEFGAGIQVEDVTLHAARSDQAYTGHFYLIVDGRGTLSLQQNTNGLQVYNAVSELHFADNSIVDFSAMDIHYYGTEWIDNLWSGWTGFTGTNYLYGMGGDDVISHGRDSNTVIDGGEGNDTLAGGGGDDIFIVGSGDDIIQTGSGAGGVGADTVKLSGSYTLSNIQFYRVNSGISNINYSGNFNDARIVIAGLGTVTLQDHFNNPDSSIEEFILPDNSTVDLYQYEWITVGGSGNDYIDNTSSLWLNKNDIYLFGAGNDKVYEDTGFDTLLFSAGITAEDITIRRSSEYPNASGGGAWDDLLISDGNGNSFRFLNHFSTNSAMTQELEQIKFADNSTIDISTLEIETHGTEQANQIDGDFYGDASFDDTIYAYGGADYIHGGLGDDYIDGGDGNDYIHGGEGEDEIYTGEGDDTLNGDVGADYLDSGEGNDIINGGAGADILKGGNGNDYLTGDDTSSTADDTLEGGAGDDTLNGGGGLDSYVYTSGNDIIDGENRYDNGDKIYLPEGITLNDLTFTRTGIYPATSSLVITVGSLGSITIKYQLDSGGSTIGVETLVFHDTSTVNLHTLDNIITQGTSGNDTLYGINNGAGTNDVLDGGAGDDTLYGQTGNDTYLYTAGTDIVSDSGGSADVIKLPVGVSAGDITIYNAGNDDILVDIHATGLTGQIFIYGHRDGSGSYAIETLKLVDNSTISITGSNAANLIYGTPDGETLNGDQGGTQNDTIYGLGGNDTLNGYNGTDDLYGGEGDDDLYGGAGNDTYYYAAGLDEIWDASGNDTLILPEGIEEEDIIMTNIGNYDVMLNFIGALTGTIILHNQRISGQEIDTLRLSDNSTVTIFATNSTNETYGTSSGETLTGDQGGVKDDTIHGLGGDDGVYGYAGNDTLYGDDGDDTVYGGADTDLIYGGAGVDTLAGDAGDDTIYGGADNDSINGNDGVDTLYGEGGVDILSGGIGDDVIDGGDGNDTLNGNNDNDTLIGGNGDDSLVGGAGNDTYVFSTGNDVISDQGGGTDRVKFGSDITLNDLQFRRYINTSTSDGDALWITDGNGNSLKVESQFGSSASSYKIEELVFDGNVVVSMSDVHVETHGSSTGISMYGIDTVGAHPDDIIYGFAGGDVLYGYSGNDYLYGGTDSDTLVGGLGNDTYIFNIGDGQDSIQENTAAGTDTVRITGISADNIRLWTSYYGDLYLQNKNDANDIITISASASSGQSLVGQYVERVEFDDGTIWDLTGGLTIEASAAGGESLYGTSYNDQLIGHSGGDYLNGNGGNDTLSGGAGNDTLSGGIGDDVYIYNVGDGQDAIYESTLSGTDTVRITGISADNIRLWTSYYGDLYLQNKNDANDIITISASASSGQSLVGQYVERVEFDDGTIWDLTGGLTIEASAAGGESLYGTSYNDQLIGHSGGDYLNGNGGNDTLSGGAGNDTLSGGMGDDTYIFGVGIDTDTVYESAAQGTDTISVIDNLQPANIRAWIDQYGTLTLQSVIDSADKITVSGSVLSTGSNIGTLVERVAFQNGAVWNLTQGFNFVDTEDGHTNHGSALIDTIEGRGGDDYLYGYDGNDTLDGGEGNDYLYGGLGNDSLMGGIGADSLSGGAGDDTYVFARGFGALSATDSITENASEGVDTISFTGDIKSTDVRMWVDTYGDLSIQLTSDPNDKLIVSAPNVSGSGATVGNLVERIVFAGDNVTWDLTQGITLIDTNDSHTSYGSAQADIIEGRGGDDYLYGYDGNDNLNGGIGADYLYGGLGNDTYILGTGFGADYIYDATNAGTDTIRLTGVNASDIRLWTDTNGYLHLQNKNILTDHVTVQAAQTSTGGSYQSLIGQYVESVVFDDNTTWNLTGALNIEGSSSADALYGTTYNDTLYGLGGDDSLYGNTGNDSLIGEAGADYLYGGVGNDTYILGTGFGADYIYDATNAGTDTIRLTGVNASDIRLWTDTNGYLHLQNKNALNDHVTVQAAQTSTGGSYQSLIGQYVEQVVFDDNTTWNLTGALTLEGSSGADSLYGTTYNDTLYGLDGDDNLYGNTGDDNLNGGIGADYLYGGVGNDTYTLGFGFGADYIYDATSAGTDVIRLTGVNAADIRLWTDTNGYLHLQNKNNLTDHVTVQAAQTSTGGSYQSLIGQYIESVMFDDNTTWSLTGALTIEGSVGADSLYGTTYHDTLSGLGGDDTLYGNTGNDTQYGGDGTDYLYGGAGNDILDGGSGNDTINGNADIDTVSYLTATSGVNFSLAVTSAQITGGAGTDTVTEVENLTGSLYGDLLIGNSGDNTINGDAGDDIIEGGVGNDTLIGGSGTDRLTYASAVAGVTVSLATLTAQNTVGAGTDTVSGFENLTGSAYNDTLTGDGNANTIEGGAGNDTINGAGGIDTLTYVNAAAAVTVNLATTAAQNTVGAGTDTISNFENLTGSGYNDTLTGSSIANVISGGAGNDTISGADGNDTLDGGDGDDTLTGGNGTDTVTYVGAVSAVTVSLAIATAQNTGGAGTDTIATVENLIGSLYGDTLTGSTAANVITGGAGNDTISAGDGNDTLNGGAGDDSLTGGNGTDTVTYVDAVSAVTVNLATATTQNTGGAGTDTLATIENLTGSAFGDTLTGNSGANTIAGGDGDDTVEGAAGNDTLTGGNGTDTVSYASAASAVTFNLATTTSQSTGGAGSDTVSGFENVTGSAYNDTLTGDANANIIRGGAGNDTLSGGAGNDILYGEAGLDAMTGGLNADIFVFQAASAYSSIDTISDFSTAQGDALNLANLLGEYDPLTEAITDFVLAATSGANTTISVDRDGTGATYGFTQIATLTGVTGLTDEAALVANGNLIVA